MRYVVSRLEDETEKQAYRIYVSDALYVLSYAVSTTEDTRLKGRYYDLITQGVKEEKYKTADEIKAHFKEKLRNDQ